MDVDLPRRRAVDGDDHASDEPMLFNSYEFILLFLPAVLVTFAVLGRTGASKYLLHFLLAASLFFYGWWAPRYLVLLGASIVANYALGRTLAAADPAGSQRRVLMWLGVAGNLGAIVYFKYAGFLVDASNSIVGTAWPDPQIVLPLAISFFTFQQVAYLVDVHRDSSACEPSLARYALFVTFFPQLIAGPIVHHGQMMPQMADREFGRIRGDDLAWGISLFVFGLWKKVIVADTLAGYATPIFDAAASGTSPSLVPAWVGALAYTFQLYFDFSGYSDMAVGLGAMFGIRLPINFHSPYRSVDIVEFWRRWHITLSTFLRDYLYIALGGSRRGRVRRHVNLMATMLLGGLWHGAGWTFVAWGGLHGAFLVLNHGWRTIRTRLGFGPTPSSAWGQALSMLVTFLAVVVAWVPFRADSFAAAKRVFAGMVGAHGIALPEKYLGLLDRVPGVSALVRGLAVQADELALIDTALWHTMAAIAIAAAIAWLLPNTNSIFAHAHPRLEPCKRPEPRWYSWTHARRWAVLVGVLAAWSIAGVSARSEFLYFRF